MQCFRVSWLAVCASVCLPANMKKIGIIFSRSRNIEEITNVLWNTNGNLIVKVKCSVSAILLLQWFFLSIIVDNHNNG